MKAGNAFKIASLCSFVILLSLYVAYSAGAFDSVLGRNTTPSQNNAKNESSPTQKDFINSSKKTEVFKPSEKDELSLQKEEEAITFKIENEPGKRIQFSSKSGPVFEKAPPNKENTKNQEKQFLGGTKTKEVFKPPLKNELKPKSENEKANKNKDEELDLELMDGTKSAPVFKKDK